MKTVANTTSVRIDIIYITKHGKGFRVQAMNHYRSARKGWKSVRKMAIWEVNSYFHKLYHMLKINCR